MIPKEFLVTSGKTVSSVSELKAFDLALTNVGIAQCNLVSVSLILPPNRVETKRKKISVDAITFAVMTRMEVAKIREIEINEMNYQFENPKVPMDNYGCIVAALVYIP